MVLEESNSNSLMIQNMSVNREEDFFGKNRIYIADQSINLYRSESVVSYRKYSDEEINLNDLRKDYEEE